MPANFYGGRVTHVGETDSGVLLFMVNNNGWQVLDTGVQDLSNLDVKSLRALLDKKKIKYSPNAGVPRLIEQLTGIKPEE